MACVSCSFDSFSPFLLSLKQQQKLMKIMFSYIHFPIWLYPPKIMIFFVLYWQTVCLDRYAIISTSCLPYIWNLAKKIKMAPTKRDKSSSFAHHFFTLTFHFHFQYWTPIPIGTCTPRSFSTQPDICSLPSFSVLCTLRTQARKTKTIVFICTAWVELL